MKKDRITKEVKKKNQKIVNILIKKDKLNIYRFILRDILLGICILYGIQFLNFRKYYFSSIRFLDRKNNNELFRVTIITCTQIHL